MSNLSIKDVPESWAEVLRQRAARNHRSLQGELLAMVQAVVEAEAKRPEFAWSNPKGSQAEKSWGQQQGTRLQTVEEIAVALKLAFPETLTNVPRAVDIIRADRDAR